MAKKGMRPNRHTYCAVIYMYFKCGDPEEAKKVYNEMVGIGYCKLWTNSKRWGSNGIEKDIITYNTLIQGLCRLGRIVEAMRFYSGALEAGLQPTISTYSPHIIALCNQGNVTDAVGLIQQMKDRGLINSSH